MMQQRKRLYPANWPSLSHQCKRGAGWRCQHCHIRHGATRLSNRTGQEYQVWLHAAHVRLHDTLNPDPELFALCPTCHGRYDYWMRMRETVVRLEMLKHRILLHQRGLLRVA